MPLKDDCQTPGYAIEPLINATDITRLHNVGAIRNDVIWEPASGEGLLLEAIRSHDIAAFGTDKKTGQDFLTCTPPIKFTAIVSNPPYSIKVPFVERCIYHGKPWALLMESNTVSLASFIELIAPLAPQIGIIWFAPRVNFKMPRKGWKGSSPFPTAWFTWGFGFSGNRFIRMPHWSKQYREKFQKG